MLLLLGHSFPFGFCLSGVIVPEKPPCFAIPFFDSVRFPHKSADYAQVVFIQDVCESDVITYVEYRLEESEQTILSKHIKTICVDSGDYDIRSSESSEIDRSIILDSRQRLYAFAESSNVVRVGFKEPLGRCLARTISRNMGVAAAVPLQDYESKSDHFMKLEIARFQKSRSLCLDALNDCFGSLADCDRSLAVHWLKMTKENLKVEGILEGTD